MADVQLVKSKYTDSDVTSLGEVAAADNAKLPGTLEVTGKITASTSIELGNASDTTLTRVSAGDIAVEGKGIYRADGTDVPVADGGTGRSTGTTAYALVATGTTATGAQQTLAAGATTEILVGGGASALPVWTTATGTGAPVRAGSPTLTGDPLAPTAASTDITAVPTQVANLTFVHNEDAMIANPKAMSQGVNMTYSASGGGSNGILVADNGNIDFGTGKFTLAWKGSLSSWATPSVYIPFIQKSDVSPGNDGYHFGYYSDGNLRVRVGGTAYAGPSINSLGLVANTVHFFAVAIDQTALTATFYFDGFPIGSAVTITLSNVSTSYNLYVSGNNSQRNASVTIFAATFNRALTAAEVLDLFRNGINFADKWGSQTPVYTSDFSAGIDSFGGADITINGNIDTISDGSVSKDDCLRVYANNVNGYHYTVSKDIPALAGKKVYLLVDYYIPTANTNVKRISFEAYGMSAVGANVQSVTGAWTTVVIPVAETFSVASSERKITIRLGTNSSWFFAGANSITDDLVYIKTFTLYQAGATLALEPEGIQPSPGQWLDSSTNKLHAMQPATGSSLIRRMKTFEVRWTNTWAGTHEAQYIGGVNQSVLPANCYIDDIIGVVSGATIEDIIIGDGSDTDRWVAATTGLAAGTTSFTLANRISDGTNYKLVVDPDANFTGSIAFTIRGIILQ